MLPNRLFSLPLATTTTTQADLPLEDSSGLQMVLASF
uniref:Uncharacterized protein n=1 Tax=Arundo donax TaxID=35708 RepID=A0A0A9B928_ARUDO